MSIVYMSGCFVLRVSIDARQIVHAFKTGELHSIIAAQMLLVFVQDDEAWLLQNSQRPRPSGCSNVPAAEPFRLSESVPWMKVPVRYYVIHRGVDRCGDRTVAVVGSGIWPGLEARDAGARSDGGASKC